MSFSKNKVSLLSTIIFIMVCLSLAKQGSSIGLNETLNYTECTPGRNCLQCLNEYLCKKCAPLQKCCPKKCVTCQNDSYCTDCEPGFQLESIAQKGWYICANSDSYNNIDYHRLKITNPNPYLPAPISTKCQKGYYYDFNIKFCQKCRVKNCDSCRDSIHCFVCQNGFFLFNGLCLTWEDVRQTFDTSKKDGQNSTAEEKKQLTQIDKENIGDAYLFFMFLGMTLGCCLTCILIQICSCIKGCCRKCFRRKGNNDDSDGDGNGIILVEDQIIKESGGEVPQKNDKRRKDTEESEMDDSFQSESLSDAVINQSKPINEK